jgi:hypothetical protein
MNFMQTAPETKSTGTDHVALADSFDEFMSAFEAFRDENDRRLRQIETRGAADVVTSEKVDRISDALDRQKKALDELALKRARPALGLEEALSAAALERKEAFEGYMRSGDERARPCRELERGGDAVRPHRAGLGRKPLRRGPDAGDGDAPHHAAPSPRRRQRHALSPAGAAVRHCHGSRPRRDRALSRLPGAGGGGMKLTLKLTLDGLLRALRAEAHRIAEAVEAGRLAPPTEETRREDDGR